MKLDLTTIQKIGLTPNGIYLLYARKRRLVPAFINVKAETSDLINKGYLSVEGELNEKGAEILARTQHLCKTKSTRCKLTEDDIPYIEKYRLLFPAGKLPSGASARASVTELKPRFEIFFGRYPDLKDWNLVLQATALYLDEAEQRRFEYTQSSENFIYKEDKHRNWTSTLSKYCQMIVEGSMDMAPAGGPSIINIPGL